MHRITSRLTYANVIATLALFLVLAGGTAFAASQFGKESIAGRALKKESIGPAKLSKAAKKTLQGPAGPSGPRGATGATGAAGQPGPAGDGKLFSFSGGAIGITGAANVASLNLPAGNYLIQGKMNAVHNGTTSSTRLECSLVNGANVVDFIKLRMAANKEAESLIFGLIPVQAAVTLAAPATINLTCASSFGDEIELSERKLTALTVSSIG
jgi:hypothetical protein